MPETFYFATLLLTPFLLQQLARMWRSHKRLESGALGVAILWHMGALVATIGVGQSTLIEIDRMGINAGR